MKAKDTVCVCVCLCTCMCACVSVCACVWWVCMMCKAARSSLAQWLERPIRPLTHSSDSCICDNPVGGPKKFLHQSVLREIQRITNVCVWPKSETCNLKYVLWVSCWFVWLEYNQNHQRSMHRIRWDIMHYIWDKMLHASSHFVSLLYHDRNLFFKKNRQIWPLDEYHDLVMPKASWGSFYVQISLKSHHLDNDTASDSSLVFREEFHAVIMNIHQVFTK